MNTDYRYILLVLVTLIILELLLLSLLIFRKARMNKRRSREDKNSKAILPLIINYLYDEDDDYFNDQMKIEYDFKVIERILSNLTITTRDETLDIKIKQLAEFFLSTHYKKALKSGTWSQRMNTLYSISNFKLDSFVPLLKDRFNNLHKWEEEKQQVARVLATFGDLSIINEVFNSNKSYPKFYRDILSRYPISAEEELYALYKISDNPFFITAYIGRIGHVGNSDKAWILESALANQNAAIRMQALKSIGHIFHMEHPELLKPFFTSEIWQERLLAVQLVNKLQLNGYKPQLKKLLGDSEWWIRNSTAETILEVEGSESLAEYANSHDDKYARDMAGQWISLEKKVALIG